MHVIICGGRTYVFNDADRRWLETMGITKVYVGGASGADSSAEWWAKARGVPCVVTHADWATHGKAAGPIRNATMLASLKRTAPGTEIAVIAFPGGRGTADMIQRAESAGMRVIRKGDV
ncbi:MAG TPA: SLOG family protein [Candidatus Tectomicrobia bacterium]